MYDSFGTILTGAALVIGLLITYAVHLSRKVDRQNDAAREGCVGVYEAFSESQVGDLPVSVRQVWETGRAIKFGG